jgi:GntP family gluconate:H+ symporter
LVAEYGKLPNGFNALAPIVVPIALMALGSISSMAGFTGFLGSLCTFLGKPVIALAAGTILAIVQLATAKKMDKFYDLTNDTLKTVGPILFVTAAGGVLGKVISSTTMVSFITEKAPGLMAMGIFFPFLLAAILKTAQGSSTVAITTTAGIMAPLMATMGLASPVMAVFSVGSDGTDGPTDAAGGYTDGDTAGELRAKGLEIYKVLQDNDAYNALKEVGGLVFTGPTGTNVNDVAVALLRVKE